MLPELRPSYYLYCVPQFELDRNDVADLACELEGFHENFADCFHRSESRDNFYRYMSGQVMTTGIAGGLDKALKGHSIHITPKGVFRTFSETDM